MKKALFIALLLTSMLTFGQSKFTVDGRVEGMPVYWKLKGDNLATLGLDLNKLYSYSSINNRLNLNWYPNSKIHFQMGLRTSYIFGDIVYELNSNLNGIYNAMYTDDPGWINLTHAWSQNENGVLVSNIDRLFLQYNGKKLTLTIGRQRINWGVNMVWLPTIFSIVLITSILIILNDREAMLCVFNILPE